MVRIISLIVFSCLSMYTFGQSDIIDWSAKANRTEKEVELIISATLAENWKLYSQFTEAGGPLPTVFSFDHSENVRLKGDIEESKNFKSSYSDLFEINVISAENEATFVQRLVTDGESEEITIKIRYMCCDGEKCIPPTTKTFALKI